MVRMLNLSVTVTIMQMKEKYIADKLYLEEFKASKQWVYNRFLRIRGLKTIYLHGEDADEDTNNPELLVSLEILYYKLKMYRPENICNIDKLV